jgi:hypothetical protein
MPLKIEVITILPEYIQYYGELVISIDGISEMVVISEQI